MSTEREKHVKIVSDILKGKAELSASEEADPARMGQASLMYRRCKDYFGNPIDEDKSDMQKRVRRGDIGAIHSFACMVNMPELFHGPRVSKSDQSLAKSIRTNALNRLIVISAEDIGVADLGVVQICLQRLLPMTWGKKRVAFDYAEAVGCLELMCAAQKTRLGSWLYCAYGISSNRVYAQGEGLAVPEDVDLRTLPLDNLACFRCFEKKQEELIWQRIFHEVPFVSEYYQLLKWLYSAFKYLSEKRPFLSLALALLHYRPAIAVPQLPAVSAERVRELENHEFSMEILPDAVDKHTARGRAAGANRALFVTKGAKLENECPLYNDEVLKRIYAKGK